jgi:hypothetical protein
MHKQEEVKKVVQREQHQQSEQFRKRLAERQKSKNNRSVSAVNQGGLNTSLSFNFNAQRATRNMLQNKATDSNQQNESQNYETLSNNAGGGFPSGRRHFGESKIGMIAKMNSGVIGGGGGAGSSSLFNYAGGNQISGNDSFFSYGKS